MVNDNNSIVMGEITDPAELARAQAQHKQFDLNAAWLHSHASKVYPKYRGKFICIAGAEVFVADTPNEAVAKATAAHPEDHGRFVHYIPREKIPHIYANRWRMVCVR